MITNLLTDSEENIGADASGWVGVTNCAVNRSTVLYQRAPASLLLTPTVVGGAVMTADLVRSVPVEGGKTYRMFCSVRTTTPGATVGIQPRLFDAAGVELSPGSDRSATSTIFGRWVLLSTTFTTPTGVVSAKVRLDAEAVASGAWFDSIVFAEWQTPPVVPFSRLMTRTIPQYMLDADETLTEPDYPLARFIDLIATQANDVLLATLAFDYISPIDGETGYDRSTLVQPEYYPAPLVAEPQWLPWLAQLVGVKPIYPASGGALTPWFYFEDNYPTWNSWQTIDPAINPAFPITSLSRNASTGTVTCVYGTQAAGPAYTPAVGDPVEITGATGFTGAYVIASVNTGTKTLTWSNPGAAATASTGTITFADVSWSEIEGANPQAFDALTTLKHLTRTAATGFRAGSEAAIINAARSVLDGVDLAATAQRTSNVVTVTTVSPHPFSIGGYVRLCESPNLTLNIVGTVASVVSPTVFTINSTGPAAETANVYATNKQVTVTRNSYWQWSVSTTADQTYAVDLLQRVVNEAKPAGVLVSFSTI